MNINMSLKATHNPFQETTFQSQGGIDYLIGALFVLLALSSLLFIRKAKQRAEEYKKRQLKEYNKNRPTQRPETDYSRTRLYLPMFERMKFSAPIMLAVLFAAVAIAFFAGKPITTL